MRKEILEVHKKIIDNSMIKNHDKYRENIELLKKLLDISDLTFFEKGWVYWQLQDLYALLRDSLNERIIFHKFTTFIKNHDEKYLFWALCDMTQVLSMRLGGYTEEWDSVYNYTNTIKVSSHEFVRAKFEMNRAYVGVFTDKRVLIEDVLIEKALSEIFMIIDSYPEHPDSLFFKLTLYALKIKYLNYKESSLAEVTNNISNLIDEINEGFEEPMIKMYDDNLLFGSWNLISKSHGKHYSTKVGLTNILFALCEANELDFIEYLLKNITNYHLENSRLIKMIGNIKQ